MLHYHQFVSSLGHPSLLHKFEEFKATIDLLKHGKKEVIR